MRDYELMYILEPGLDEDSTQALIGQIEDFMSKQGVTIDKTDPWGKRRLAYNIGKHWEGFYVLSHLKADSGAIAELERRLRVTDGVLRFITVRIDEEQAKLERQRARKSASRTARQQKRGIAEPAAVTPAPTPAEPVTESTPAEPVAEAAPAPATVEPPVSAADADSSESSDSPEKAVTEGVADTVAAEQPETPESPDIPEENDKKTAEPAGEGS
jgi:small subunit ribosomal protein S6